MCGVLDIMQKTTFQFKSANRIDLFGFIYYGLVAFWASGASVVSFSAAVIKQVQLGGGGMSKNNQRMSSIEMRALILEALSIADVEKTPRNVTFKMSGYKGTVKDLLAIVEHLAIQRGLVDRVIPVYTAAWGTPGEIPWSGINTNLYEAELDTFNEQIHFLVFQNVISPGAYGNYGSSLPYFHVTEYGLRCLQYQDVLPYDPDKYLARLQSINSFDEWELFYVAQSLLCYNTGAIEASIIMLGLAGEYLAERLINNMLAFLSHCEPRLHEKFKRALANKKKISQRYSEYEAILAEVERKKHDAVYAYPQLRDLKPRLDDPAKSIYATYLRLTRNEIAHPSCVKMDRSECLVMLISFIRYCETQHEYLDFYTANS